MRRLGRSSLRRLAALVAAPALVLAAGFALPHAAAAGPTAVVSDSAEAWFATASTDPCSLVTGCPQGTLADAFPAGTLHVASDGGQEAARSYLVPDLSGLPPGATVLGGLMTIPLAADPQSGTVAADYAEVKACLVTQPVTDAVYGSTATPPAIDCSVTTPAAYSAAAGTLTVDLGMFATAWASGRPEYGVALVPDTPTGPANASWHIALNGRQRAGVGHVRVELSYQPAAAAPSAPTPATSVAPPVRVAPVPPPAAAPLPALTAPPVAPQVAPPPATSGVTVAPRLRAAAFTRVSHYPLPFVLALVLAAGAMVLARMFTKEIDVTDVS